jgi:hypothetical protein
LERRNLCGGSVLACWCRVRRTVFQRAPATNVTKRKECSYLDSDFFFYFAYYSVFLPNYLPLPLVRFNQR